MAAYDDEMRMSGMISLLIRINIFLALCGDIFS